MRKNRKGDLIPFPVGASVIFWLGIGYLCYTVYRILPYLPFSW